MQLNKIALSIAFTAGFAVASAQQKAPVYEGYTLVWQDEFNGEKLDEDAWNIEVNGNGGGNNELQYYCRNNVTIENEPSTGVRCLTLTARREDYNGKKFTSGRLNTLNKVYFTHGRIESRIMMPRTKNGLWPAFWMMGNDYPQVGWPRCGETDIVEMGNSTGISKGTQTKYFNGACHWGYYNSENQYPNYAKSTTNSYDIQDGCFHLFTCIWDDNYLRFYLDLDKYPDAKPYYEMGISDTNGDWATGNYFHKDNFIIYDLAVGGYFTGITDPSKITALPEKGSEKKMYIDWVRVYQTEDDLPIIYPDSYSPGHEDEGSIEGTGIIDNGDSDGPVTTSPEKVTISSAPVPTQDASKVLSIYSDKYESAAPDMFFNDWTSATYANSVGTAVINNDGDNMFRIKNFSWYGIDFGKTIDTSDYNYLHIDLKSETNGAVAITPITGDTEMPQKVEVTSQEWSGFDIPVQTYIANGMNMSKNYQIKLAGSSTLLYIDNVYYWKGSIDAINEVTSFDAPLEIYDIQGRRLTNMQHGINIVRTLNGTQKVFKE